MICNIFQHQEFCIMGVDMLNDILLAGFPGRNPIDSLGFFRAAEILGKWIIDYTDQPIDLRQFPVINCAILLNLTDMRLHTAGFLQFSHQFFQLRTEILPETPIFYLRNAPVLPHRIFAHIVKLSAVDQNYLLILHIAALRESLPEGNNRSPHYCTIPGILRSDSISHRNNIYTHLLN